MFLGVFTLFISALSEGVFYVIGAITFGYVGLSSLYDNIRNKPAILIDKDAIHIRRWWVGSWSEILWGDVERVSVQKFRHAADNTGVFLKPSIDVLAYETTFKFKFWNVVRRVNKIFESSHGHALLLNTLIENASKEQVESALRYFHEDKIDTVAGKNDLMKRLGAKFIGLSTDTL